MELKIIDSISNQSKILIQTYMQKPTNLTVQFLLDASVLPDIIIAIQEGGANILQEIFHFTRSWCYAMHRKRMQLLGRWSYY